MRDTVVVKVVTSTGREGCDVETLYIDGENVMRVGPLSECPEDAILERDLVGPSTFSHLLQSFLMKHKGKKVKFEYENGEEEE